jgi:hypothetical protein
MFWIGLLIAAIGGLLSISLIRRVVKQYFPGIRDIYLDGLLDLLLIVFVPIGLIISGVNYVDEVKKGEELNSKIEALRSYSDVARLNILGKTGIAGAGLIETTPISK